MTGLARLLLAVWLLLPLHVPAIAAVELPIGSPAEQTPAASASSGEQAALAVLDELGVRPLDPIAQYEQWKLRFNQRSYEWHLISTVLIFVVVMGIVLFGLRLTWLQFTREHHPARRVSLPSSALAPGEGEAGGPAPGPVVSSVKISAAGIEVSSQVIGLLVLAFSLAFFYLYLKEVYPMQIAATKAPDKESSQP